MPVPLAADDIVATHAEGAENSRPPLLVLEPLLAFLDANGLGEGEPEVTPIGEGHSNVTFMIRRGGAEFVLRRPPRPPIPPSANDMLREARVLRALEGRARVPKILAVCEDEGVIGAPFYVMELLAGHEVTSVVPEALDTVEDRWRMGMGLVEALVEIHAVDWRQAGLEGFGKPEGYLERQLRRFGGLWEHNKTREVAEFEEAARWLAAHMPESGPATIVHGDFRLGNVLVSLEPPARVVSVLDWEMSTIGDPLADLGYLTATWIDHDDPPGGAFELSMVTREPGFPTRDELAEHYEELSGRPIGDIRWYQVLALWKAVVFMEGNYRRAASGLTDDPYLASFGEGVVKLAQQALDLTRED